MKLKAILSTVSASVPVLALAVNAVIVDTNGNPIGECALTGAAVAQDAGAQTVAGISVSASSSGDLLLVIDQTAPGCAIGGATNQAPAFTQASPYDAGSVTVSGSKNISLSASDPDGDTLTWSISSQPTSGMGTAVVSGTGNTKSVTYTAGSTAGNAQFVVQVDDGNGGTASLTVNITVTSTQLPAACNNVNPGIPADTSAWGQSGQRVYTPLEKNASHADVGIANNKYKYKQAVTVTDGDSGQILFEDTAYFDIAPKIVSLSECPGDFGGPNGTALSAACVRSSNTTGIMTFYYTTPSGSQTFGCMLDPNKTYYLNVVHATDVANLAGSSTCTASTCGFNIDTIEN